MAEAAAVPAANADPVVDVEPTELEVLWGEFELKCQELIDANESFSKRLFGTSANYRKKMGLSENAPGKKEFRRIQTLVRGIRTEGERVYKKHKPKKPREASNGTTGFNRLVVCTPELTKLMKLADWSLVSTVNPSQGIATHGDVTRHIAIYAALNNLHNRGQNATWRADEDIRSTFKNEWAVKGVDPNAVQYTDVQKLIAPHMTTIQKGTVEQRNESVYRAKLNKETGEYGKAVHTVMNLRKELDEIQTNIHKSSGHVISCREHRKGQPILAQYETKLRNLLVQWDGVATKMRDACKSGDFKVAPEFPIKPKTAFDIQA